MNDISVVMASQYNGRFLTMIKNLGDSLCCCYGIGFPRGYIFSDEPLEKMILTKVTSRISNYVVSPLCSVLGRPNYYRYLSNVEMFDRVFAKKVAKDKSKVVFVNFLLCHTIEACKKNGKIIVCEAGNAEPSRENARITAEYKQFGIKHGYIFGDKKYTDRVLRSLETADKIVTISKCSEKTYIDAGYDTSRLHFIPMTGSDVPVHDIENITDKPKAFISTGFQSFIKGTHRLLLAWKNVDSYGIPLLIIGRINEDIKEFVSKYGPFNNVQFLGYQENLLKTLSAYDAVGVQMSLSEGAIRVTPEMMSFGFPMVTSPDAACDLVEDGKNGFIIDPWNEELLVQRLQWFAEDWNRVHGMRKQVLDSVSYRTLTDYSLELGNYLRSLV